MRKFFRILYYFGITLLFVLIAFAGFTQTRTFRSYIQSLILSKYPAVVHGNLQLGALEGNLVSGFSISNVELSRNGIPLLQSERIEVRYDPFGFLFKRVAISRITVRRPSISLYRSRDSTWNVSDLFAASKDTTTSHWTIEIKALELQDAAIRVIDSIGLARQGKGNLLPGDIKRVNYSNVKLESLNLLASAEIHSGSNLVQIRKLAFAESHTEIRLRELSGEFLLAKNEARIRGLRIETDHSRLRLDASLKNHDVTKIVGLEEFESIPVSLRLNADRLDTRELRQFLYPWVDFLDKSVALTLSASGTLANLSIENLTLQTPRSYLRIEGILTNIHRPKDIGLDLFCSDNKVNPKDLLEYLPGLHLPNLDYLGEVNFSLSYAGRPIDFKSKLQAQTAVGDVDVQGDMSINQGMLGYDLTVKHSNVDLAPILNDEQFQSTLNGRFILRGSGTSLQTIGATLRAELDSSEFYGLPVGKSVIVVDAFQGTVRSRLSLRAGQTEYDLTGRFDEGRGDSLVYAVSGKVNSLDLAPLLKDKLFASDLSFAVDAGGTVMGKGARDDSVRVEFLRSAYADTPFDHGVIRAHFTSRDSLRRALTIRSDALDLQVDGEFNPLTLPTMISSGVQLVVKSIAHRFETLDSLRSFHSPTMPKSFLVTIQPSSERVDVQLKADVKDLFPVGVIAHVPLAGKLELSGNLVGTLDDLLLKGTTSVDQFAYGGHKDTVVFIRSMLDFTVNGISRSDILNSLEISLDARASAGEINSLILDAPTLTFSMLGDSANFAATSGFDSAVVVETEGTAGFADRRLGITMSDVNVRFGEYAYENMEPVQLMMAKDGFQILDMKMHHEAEEVEASGYFNPSGISDCRIDAREILLNNVHTILHRTNAGRNLRDLAGILNGTAKLRGSLDHPNISLSFAADGIRARNRVFGRVTSRLSYFEHLMNVYVEFRSQTDIADADPDLLLSGIVPYELTLAPEPEHELTGDVDLVVRSKALDLAFLDPFIPEISNLTGTLACDMRMRGPLRQPRYDGLMTIRGAKFFFKPLGFQYQLDGKLVPSGDHIVLQDVVIRNAPDDYADGALNITGTFTMLGLTFRQFDFYANGQLKVMKESFHQPGQKFYGDLIAASGANPIHWEGDLNHSLVKGEMYIKYAQMILPPERETFVLLNRSTSITFVDDTSSQRSKDVEPGVNGGKRGNGEKENPAIVLAPRPQQERSFLDGIDYDMAIETKGPTQIRFVFNSQTSEELYADLQGRVYYVKNPNAARLTGEVAVGSSSYYNFFKKFQATGKLLFTGDPFNPELDIQATYQGLHKDTTASSNPLAKDQLVVVTIGLKGPRNQLKVKWDMQMPGASDQQQSADVEGDAITFILTGQFRNELSDQQRRSLIGTNLGYGFASGILTGPLSEALRRNTFGYVQSIDVLYYGGGSFDKSADVRLTGQVGEAVIRAGGRVLSDLNNTNVSVEFPMSALTGADKLRNLILTLERRVEGLDNQFDEQRRSSSNGARLFYRITF